MELKWEMMADDVYRLLICRRILAWSKAVKKQETRGRF